MFGKQSDPSRTEEATPKRKRKQRQEGNVPKSQELGKVVSIVGGLIILNIWLGPMADKITLIFRQFLQHSTTFDVTEESVYALFFSLSIDITYLLMPVLLFLAGLSFLAQRLQVGKLWTFKVFKFRLERFNILRGIKQCFFSPQTVLRALKSLVFSLILGCIPGYILWTEYLNFLPMYYATPEGVAAYMLETALKVVKYSLIPLIAIAIFDVWQSRYAYNESLKMTKDEVKDERKQAEGDPVIKNKQRQKMMEVMARRMLADVPKADVVVTNPTHIAVALSYNPSEAPAPVVLAKGVNRLAEKIKEVARENRVPIRENVPLARALYKSVEVGEMIPEDLYKAVAAVLASIWRLKPRNR